MSPPRRFVSLLDCALRRRLGTALSSDGKRGLWTRPNRVNDGLHAQGSTAQAPSKPSRTTPEDPFARARAANYPY